MTPAKLTGMSTQNARGPGEFADETPDVPPGFEGQEQEQPAESGTSAAAQQLAAAVQKVSVDGTAPAETDAPDLSLRLQEGLREPEAEKEIKTVSADNTIYQSASSFEQLGLSPQLLQGIYNEMRFEKPSRIQALTLPMILTPPFRDLIAQAHNGSGKTTCFVLSMLSRVDPNLSETQALCICPTRELVIQNEMVLKRMAKFTTITTLTTAQDSDGPFNMRQRIKEQVVIGTHGKLKNWMSKRLLDVGHVNILVFDEADEMLKADGFADDSVRMIREVRRRSPGVQLLLFSATFNEKVKNFAVKISPRANQVFVPKEELSLDVIAQYNVSCPGKDDKVKVLKDMIFPNCERLGQTIIFVRTRETARTLHLSMEREGYKCTSIEGGMEKSDRDRVVQEFRNGTTKILISTDVLSRGFDVSQVTLVINFDVPLERDGRTPNYETYLHRIGRSGRFGRKGAAFNLVTGHEEQRMVDAIAAYFKRQIPLLPCNDEDAFLEALKKADLTD